MTFRFRVATFRFRVATFRFWVATFGFWFGIFRFWFGTFRSWTSSFSMGWHDARFVAKILWMKMKMEMIFFDGIYGNEDEWEYGGNM